MRKSIPLLLLSFGLLMTACHSGTDQVTSINIIDRNGISETISSKERLVAYQKKDFLAPQPYQKVMRVYGRTKSGDVSAQITSYHPNGQIKQYLEAVNSRAYGVYREWFQNGQQKIDALVIGGVADLNTQAEEDWLFDGTTLAWDEEGHLAAKIFYAKGELDGTSEYYHPNGKVWKLSPYEKGNLEGTQKIFLNDGALFQTTDYHEGQKSGTSVRYWDLAHIAYHEKYSEGKLLDASYYDQKGKSLAQITHGNGLKAIFNKKNLDRLETFCKGVQEGPVNVFNEEGVLLRTYTIVNGEKQGEEIDFFPEAQKPKLLLAWCDGLLHGTMKSWYENGQLESQREMSQNKKCGLLTAWYESGALMLLEEYDQDTLVKGEYYREGEKEPVTRVENGSGIATLFSADGCLSHRVPYDQGKPLS